MGDKIVGNLGFSGGCFTAHKRRKESEEVTVTREWHCLHVSKVFEIVHSCFNPPGGGRGGMYEMMLQIIITSIFIQMLFFVLAYLLCAHCTCRTFFAAPRVPQTMVATVRVLVVLTRFHSQSNHPHETMTSSAAFLFNLVP